MPSKPAPDTIQIDVTAYECRIIADALHLAAAHAHLGGEARQ